VINYLFTDNWIEYKNIKLSATDCACLSFITRWKKGFEASKQRH